MHTLTQFSDIATLLAGAMTGSWSIDEILTRGDTGIGTLDGSDGEVIILDKNAWHVSAEGTIRKLSGTERSPYAAVTYFDTYAPCTEVSGTAEDLMKALLDTYQHAHHFMAIKVQGHFKRVQVRAVPKQTPPYQLFSSMEAPEWDVRDTTGTLVGFYTPPQYEGVSVKGFHLHFLSESHDQGGHVIDFELDHGTLAVTLEDDFRQVFSSTQEAAQLRYDSKDLLDEINKSE